jgi:diacylglycerol kinase family enzyme
MKTLVIANPVAGRGRVAASLSQLRELFSRYLPDHDFALTSAPLEAESIARQASTSGFDAVIAE